jgi:hypothetical protein
MVLVWLLVGLAVLAVLLGLGRLFVGADPRALATGLRWTGASVLGGLAVPVFLSGRVMPAALLVMAALWVIGRLPPSALRMLGIPVGGPFGGSRGGRPSAGQTSGIESTHLRMTLDHDTGTFTGTVLEGRFRGRTLAEMSRTELMELLAELRVADERGATLLEAWLDRIVGPDWRDAEGAASGDETPRAEPPPRGEAMTADEAYRILGLEPGADEEAIREAHRRLMRHTHPDAGGSAWLAARVNAAKDFLLKRGRRG